MSFSFLYRNLFLSMCFVFNTYVCFMLRRLYSLNAPVVMVSSLVRMEEIVEVGDAK